jgi:hypothetical protein
MYFLNEEIISSVLVRYLFYPNGTVMVFVSCRMLVCAAEIKKKWLLLNVHISQLTDWQIINNVILILFYSLK